MISISVIKIRRVEDAIKTVLWHFFHNFCSVVFLYCTCSLSDLFFQFSSLTAPLTPFTVEHYWSCYVDQPVCGHLNNHSAVACGNNLHAPEGCPADTQDCPQICNVPGKRFACSKMCAILQTMTQTDLLSVFEVSKMCVDFAPLPA